MLKQKVSANICFILMNLSIEQVNLQKFDEVQIAKAYQFKIRFINIYRINLSTNFKVPIFA